MIESITYNTESNKLIVVVMGGEIIEYTQTEKDQYLSRFPDRSADTISNRVSGSEGR
jgi:hypothetical protein